LWGQFGFDPAHTGYNTGETELGASTVGGLAPKWSIVSRQVIEQSQAVADGVVYYGDEGGNLSAVDVASGSLLWRTNVGGQILASPAVGNGFVYISSSTGYLYAVRVSDGQVAWKFKLTGFNVEQLPSPVVIGDTVYVSPDTGGSPSPSGPAALNGTTGAVLWQTDIGGQDWATPAVTNGTLFDIDAWDGQMVALSAASGLVLWRRSLGTGAVIASPVVVGSTTYTVTQAGKLWALSSASGHVKWTKTLGSYAGAATPAFANGVLYQTYGDCGKRTVIALRATSGKTLWSHQYENSTCTASGGFEGTPVVANGVLYLSEMNARKLRMFNATTGRLLGVVQIASDIPGFLSGTVTVAGGQAYLGFWDGAPETGGLVALGLP
jgi:outer membrane protein assembly factor BamB